MDVRFIFVNLGSTIPPLEHFVPSPTKLRDVHQWVLAHLHTHSTEYSHVSTAALRLLCMGKELDSNLTLNQNQVPQFSTHSTPIHVMLASDWRPPPHIIAQTGFAGRDDPPGGAPPPGCCTIM